MSDQIANKLVKNQINFQVDIKLLILLGKQRDKSKIKCFSNLFKEKEYFYDCLFIFIALTIYVNKFLYIKMDKKNLSKQKTN